MTNPSSDHIDLLTRSKMAARQLTGQVQPGEPIPQPPGPPPLDQGQGLQLIAEALAVVAAQTTRMTAALEAMERRQAAELEVLQEMNKLTDSLGDQAQSLRMRMDELISILNGFTDEGASIRTAVADPFAVAYAAVAAPLLAISIRNRVDSMPIPDLIKISGRFANDIVEDMAAYREQRVTPGALEQTLNSLGDPWGGLQS